MSRILNPRQDKLHEAVVNLTRNKVESNVLLGPHQHANGDGEEIIAIEKILLADPGVQAEIAKLKLPEGTVVVADPWIYGEFCVTRRPTRRWISKLVVIADPGYIYVHIQARTASNKAPSTTTPA